jgi:iron complex outermembrane recepter protein
MKTFSYLLFGLLFAVYSQSTITGKITDVKTGEALVGANVYLKGTTIGAAANMDGVFEFVVNNGGYTIVASYVGYVNSEKKIDVNDNQSIDFELKSDLFSREVVVTANRAKFRETPVAFTNIESVDIENKAATLDVPMLLNSVPGVYATEQGGGSGDSRINIRGFSTENIAVMINGVPVNDMENGWVYWSNWSGLADVTSSIQVQRGLGASKLSASSVGGTINVITKSTDSEQKGFYKQSIGAYNTFKETLGYSTGIMDNKWALSFMVSKKDGDGYADQTWTDEMTYFASIGFLLENHSLNINVVGTPQKHGQRNSRASKEFYEAYGYNASNESWGVLNGKNISVRENFYHKPVLDINHVWSINKNSSLNNILYASWGTGGGKGTLTNQTPLKADGTYDIQSVYNQNTTTDRADAVDILRASRNDHNWYGIISSYNTKLEDDLNLTFGFDGRYYKGEHFREVEDLWGADKINYRVYKTFNQSGVSSYGSDTGNNVGRGEGADRKNNDYVEGDKIAYHNDGLVRQYGVFGQAEQKFDNTTAFINGSIYQKGYKRVDYFSYVDLAGNDVTDETEYKNFTGGHIKFGANYNMNESSNIYFNAGYLSIAPSFDAVWINFVNEYNEGVKNESVYSAELGYGYTSTSLAINANAYYTDWRDRYYSFRANNINYLAFDGISQRHLGFELDTKFMVTSNIELDIAASHALNIFTENFEINSYNEQNEITGQGTLFAKDLYISDQPMTVVSLGINFKMPVNNSSNFFINPVAIYSDRYYSNTNFGSRLNDASLEGVQPWNPDAYTKLDLTFGYRISFDNSFIKEISLIGNIYNLTGEKYVTDAFGDTESTSTMFFGRERYINFGVNLKF